MYANKMTGEPNQQNPTSVFGFDTYPPPYEVSWNQANPFTNPAPEYTTQHQQIFGQDPRLTFPSAVNISPVQSMPSATFSSVSPESTYNFEQQYSGFCFGSQKTSGDVVSFPFERDVLSCGTREIRCKRKIDSPPLQVSKQHITEEKMAEHMSKLHISSETALPKETDTSRMQRLYLCEEMRKLQTDSILPQSLLSRIQRPCTALVLWKPPTKLIPILDNAESDKHKVKESESDKTNTSNEAEMKEENTNNMDLDGC